MLACRHRICEESVTTPALGSLLRQWRRRRGRSQLALALEAGVSARHVSFVESGRANPSREMVLRLSGSLDLPLRERNALLLVAGYAPVYPESALEAPDLAPARRALGLILDHQEPFPAVVMNRRWELTMANRGAARFFGLMVDLAALPQPANIIRLMLDPAGVRPYVANWDQVAPALVERMRREAAGGVPVGDVEDLIDEALRYPGVEHAWRSAAPAGGLEPLLPVHFRTPHGAMRFFSTVTTLGTPQDVTLQELRIECFFPADDSTETAARKLAAERSLGP
jgi:transcriptional regulator with XRE-family HTH domain